LYLLLPAGDDTVLGMEERAMPTDRDFDAVIAELAGVFASRAIEHDEGHAFVSENYQALRNAKVFSAAVPKELGGRGIPYHQMSAALRTLGRACGSTALSLSMHQHLVAAQTFNHLHGKPGRKLLEKVAAEEIVLVSTGAGDWLSSNGTLERVSGGYRFTAKKAFASGAPAGALLITSGVYQDPDAGPQVLHFPVAFNAEGVRILDDWQVMGMRATGSHTVSLSNVFVPEESVSLKRPRREFHPVFALISAIALPYIVSVYVGIAEAAAVLAKEHAQKKLGDPATFYLLGEMQTELTTAQLALDSMIALANEYDFEPSAELASQAVTRKSIAAKACIATVEKALEVTGGRGFFRELGLERMLRDVHGSQFHPMQEKPQQLFTGRVLMGLPPVG
jgi:acyl-CoA dehydrogenase